MILRDRNPHIPLPILKIAIEKLLLSAKKLQSEQIQYLLREILPTYSPRALIAPLQEQASLSTPKLKAEA